MRYDMIVSERKGREKMVTRDQKKEFTTILEEKRIRPVYQPIVSLKTGDVYAYEALTRVSLPYCSFNTEQMFHIAEELNCVWKLEELCRKMNLKHAGNGKLRGKRLFINVDPNVIHDEKFKEGITCKYLKKYGLAPSDIIFEITERTSIDDAETFRNIINHYKKQQYRIAIDDFGTAYAGLARVCALEPHYLKIDMSIIRGVHKDAIKHSMVESIAAFCQNLNIRVIAEGIETKEELDTLIKIGIHFGQGYYLQRPQEKIEDIPGKIRKEIKTIYNKYSNLNQPKSFWSNVGSICSKKETAQKGTGGYEVFDYVRVHPEVREVTVIDEKNKVCGVLTRTRIMELFGGRYGYSLHGKKYVEDLMEKSFLAVDESFSIEVVSKMAMVRPLAQLYDDVVVTHLDEYKGRVSVKNLLETAINIQLNRAEEANPLTGFPGNRQIEKRMEQCVNQKEPFSIAYLDLDNFKAYNDAYGFKEGDSMIRTVAKSMQEACENDEFLGHVGGDDFVIISDAYNLEGVCEKVIQLFDEKKKLLYCREDYERGYIKSVNRKGGEECFPLATLSIAIISNKNYTFQNMSEFSGELVKKKKAAKHTEGNSIQIL